MAAYTILAEGKVDNFLQASHDYRSAWISLFALSLPWMLLFDSSTGGDTWYLVGAAVSIAINSYVIYRITRRKLSTSRP